MLQQGGYKGAGQQFKGAAGAQGFKARMGKEWSVQGMEFRVLEGLGLKGRFWVESSGFWRV